MELSFISPAPPTPPPLQHDINVIRLPPPPPPTRPRFPRLFGESSPNSGLSLGQATPASLVFPNYFVLYDLTYTGCHNGQLQSPMLTLIVLAPAWIAAFDYMTLGRLINTFLPSKSALGLRARRITLIFVLFDILLVDPFFFPFHFSHFPSPLLTHSLTLPRHPRLNLLF